MISNPIRSAGRPWRGAVLLLATVLFNPARSAAVACVGDCNTDSKVTVTEVIACVNIALGSALLSACPGADANDDGKVTVSEVVLAVTNVLNGCRLADTPTPTPTATPLPPTPTPTSDTSAVVPTSAPELFAWLQAGSYRDWPAESALHRSPVHGTVRVFVNPTLFASLEAGSPSHPAGAAAVKELHRGSDLVGWSVILKVQDDSDRGNGWYWYERLGSSTFASGRGDPGCTGCHSLGKDFFRSDFPLQ